MGIGFYFGPGIIAALHGPELTTHLLVSVMLLTLLVLLTWQIRRTVLPGRRAAAFGAGRGRKIEAAVLAGLLAMVETATVQIIVLAVFTELPTSLPERALLAMVSVSGAGHGILPSPLTAPIVGLIFIPAGVFWAVVYALWIEPRLHGPDWLKGTVFAFAPTSVSWFIVLPLLDAGLLGRWLDVGLVLAVGELVRNAAYGLALGLAYPMSLLARGSSDLIDGVLLQAPLPTPRQELQR